MCRRSKHGTKCQSIANTFAKQRIPEIASGFLGNSIQRLRERVRFEITAL
jgi:hypothetical protein